MKKKQSVRLSDLVVQAKDCYDPRDYVLVHKDYLARLLADRVMPRYLKFLKSKISTLGVTQ